MQRFNFIVVSDFGSLPCSTPIVKTPEKTSEVYVGDWYNKSLLFPRQPRRN